MADYRGQGSSSRGNGGGHRKKAAREVGTPHPLYDFYFPVNQNRIHQNVLRGKIQAYLGGSATVLHEGYLPNDSSGVGVCLFYRAERQLTNEQLLDLVQETTEYLTDFEGYQQRLTGRYTTHAPRPDRSHNPTSDSTYAPRPAPSEYSTTAGPSTSRRTTCHANPSPEAGHYATAPYSGTQPQYPGPQANTYPPGQASWHGAQQQQYPSQAAQTYTANTPPSTGYGAVAQPAVSSYHDSQGQTYAANGAGGYDPSGYGGGAAHGQYGVSELGDGGYAQGQGQGQNGYYGPNGSMNQ